MKNINVLIPFDLIVDTDMGLIKLIQTEYHNTDIFGPAMLQSSNESIQYFLSLRQDPNPLSILMDTDKEDVKEVADDLYRQFMEREYEKILSLSGYTAVASLVATISKSIDNVARVTVLCKNQLEADEVKKRKLPVSKAIIQKPEDVEVWNFDAFYVKDVKDLDRYKYFEAKSLYVAAYGFNIKYVNDDPTPLLPEEYILKYGSNNEYLIFSVYLLREEDIPEP